jgi:large subunit ribosomal protein L10
MKKSQKIFEVDNLTEKLKQVRSLIFADYSGLKVDQINKLRQEIKKAGGEFGVVKNTLLSKASQSSELKIDREQLKGPTVALWIYNDDISPLKILDKFIKKNELPKIKFGFWGNEMLDNERITQLANLPGIEELRAKFIGLLKSPLYWLATNLNGNVLKLLYLLKVKGFTLSEAKGGEN